MAIVLTMGTFDLPHSGHMHLFEQCKKIAGSGEDGFVHVGLNPDRFVAEFKGRPPIQTYEERRSIIRANRYVDFVHQTPGADAKPLIELVNPDFLVIGSDWAPPKDYYGQLQITPEWLHMRDIALLYLDRWSLHSSTELKARIRES